MGCGGCISGSTARRWDATSPACGGAATTSTPIRVERGGATRVDVDRLPYNLTSDGFPSGQRARVLWHLRAALHEQRCVHNRLVRIAVGHGRHANRWRMDDVDGLDADADTNMARRRHDVRRHVDRHDDGDDAAGAGPDAATVP